MTQLSELLKNHTGFASVVRSNKPFRKLDFSESNPTLLEKDLSDTTVFTNYVFEDMLAHSTYNGIGGYNEHRVIYRRLDHFVKHEENPRCIHLGVDIWAPAGESIYAPLASKVHSYAFNDRLGDYGPTLILEHELAGITFHTLYGHLSLNSLDGLFEGKKFEAGDRIADIGNFPVNGDWPPHLHFQIITHIGAYKGDYPGVCSEADRQHYLSICPDPNLILNNSELL